MHTPIVHLSRLVAAFDAGSVAGVIRDGLLILLEACAVAWLILSAIAVAFLFPIPGELRQK